MKKLSAKEQDRQFKAGLKAFDEASKRVSTYSVQKRKELSDSVTNKVAESPSSVNTETINVPENELKKYTLEQLTEEVKSRQYAIALKNTLEKADQFLSEQTKGIWRIYGEDSNSDIAGVHKNRRLASVKGTLEKAINCALELNGFFVWGKGGYLKLSKTPGV